MKEWICFEHEDGLGEMTECSAGCGGDPIKGHRVTCQHAIWNFAVEVGYGAARAMVFALIFAAFCMVARTVFAEDWTGPGGTVIRWAPGDRLASCSPRWQYEHVLIRQPLPDQMCPELPLESFGPCYHAIGVPGDDMRDLCAAVRRLDLRTAARETAIGGDEEGGLWWMPLVDAGPAVWTPIADAILFCDVFCDPAISVGGGGC